MRNGNAIYLEWQGSRDLLWEPSMLKRKGAVGAGAPRARSILAEAIGNVKHFFSFLNVFLSGIPRQAARRKTRGQGTSSVSLRADTFRLAAIAVDEILRCAQDDKGRGRTDCHTIDVGHWFAMTRKGTPPGDTRRYGAGETSFSSEAGETLLSSGAAGRRLRYRA